MVAQLSQDRRKTIIFLSVLLLIALCLLFVIGYPFFTPIAYAIILATVCQPLHALVLKNTRKKNVAALISTMIIFLLIVVPVAFILNVAAVQAVSLAHGIAEKSASQGGLVPFASHLMERPLQLLSRFVDLSTFNLNEQLADHLKTFAVKLLPTAAGWVGNVFGAIVNTVLALIACYFLLRDSEIIVNKALSLLPVSEAQAHQLVDTLKNTIVANVQGVFAVGAAQGIATGIALAILGVEPATLLGIGAAFCSIIPVFGTGLVWGPAAIYLIATGHLVRGLILIGIGVGLISMLDNVVRPLVVGTRVQANAFVIMLAMLGGVQAFGFLGIFIGPIVTAMVVAVSTMLSEEVEAARSHHPPDISTNG